MRRGHLALTIGAPTLLFILLGVLWQVVATNLKSILPPLEDIAEDVFSRPLFYLENLWVTLSTALIGFAVGVLVAIVIAVLVVRFRYLRAAVMPVALLLNVTPIVAIAPALVVAFGFNTIPHIIVAAISAFFPMLINALTGLQAIDPQAEEVFKAMSASSREMFFRLRIPSSLPYLFAGARLAIAAAMIGAVVAEFFGTDEGLGAVIVMATAFLNLSQMWAAILFSALTSLALLGLVGLLEKAVVRW